MIRFIIFICCLSPIYLWSTSPPIFISNHATPSTPICDCFVTQGENTYPLPFFSANQTAIDFYAYGVPTGSSSNTGLELSNEMIIILYEDSLSGETSLILILDAENDGSGGNVDINFNCLPFSAFVALSDDNGELTGSPPNIVGNFSWASCCTDGGIIGGVGCGHTITIDPDIGSGIDGFSIVHGNPSFPNYINMMESDCPITIDCGGSTCCEDAFEFEADTQNSNCSQGTDGSINLTTTCTIDPSFEWSNGEITEDITGLSPGTYTVTITDNGGCMLTESYLIGINELVLEVSSVVQNIGCWNDMNAAISISVTNSVNTPFSYIWSNGETTQDLTNLDIGTYFVTVTDINGCMGIHEFNITQPNELTGTIINIIQPVDPLIFGSAGTVILGGSPTYFYLWDNGESTPTATSLEPGVHNVTITDINGCEVVLSVDIYEPLSAAIDIFDQFCDSDCTGSIDLEPIGGFPPYSYSWSNGATTQNITDLCAGFYTCGISDEVGTFFIINISIDAYPDLYLFADFSSTICDISTNGYIDLSISGGLSPYTFTWSNDSISEDISQLTSGIYEVTVTDFNNCTVEDVFLITQSPSFSFESNINPAECAQNNGDIMLSNLLGDAPFTYLWSSGESTESLMDKSAGIYSLTITDDNGCSQIHSFEIHNTQGSSLNYNVQNVSCDNGADGSISIIVINGSPPFTYSWSSGDSTNYIDNLPVGDYGVTVTDSGDCTYISNFNLTTTSFINAITTVVDESCIGLEDGVLQYDVKDGLSPFQYIWSTGETDPIIDSLAPGLYRLDITDSLGCFYSVDFNILQGNTASFVDTIIHNLCADQLNGSIQINMIGNDPFAFEWDNSSTDSIISNLASGNFFVTATDVDGCVFEKQFQINAPSVITNAFDIIQPGCNEDTLGAATTLPNGGIGDFNFLWSNGQSTNAITDLAPGVFMVTISDDNNCTLVDSLTIVEGEPIDASAIVDSIPCFGDFASIELITLSGVDPFQFLWDDGNTDQIRNDLDAGLHSVVITDDIGCIHSLSFVLNQPDTLVSTIIQSIPPTSNGGDGLFQININGGDPPYSIQWSNGSTDVLTIDNLDYGTYIYTIIDANGCINTGQVVFNALPLTANIDISTNQCFDQCIGSIDIEILGGAMPYSFLWSNESESDAIDQLCNGLYGVTVTDDIGNVVIYNDLIIDSPPILSSTNITTDETCINLNDGTISIDAFGGTPPYEYILNGIISSNYISNLQEGDYIYEIVDILGCSTSMPVTVNGISPLDLDVVPQNINCDYPGGSIVITSDNINNYDILINGTSYGTNNIISNENLIPGNYSIQYQINNQCIEDVGEVVITDEQLFDVSFDSDFINISLYEDFSLNIIVSDPSNLIQTIDWFSNAVIHCDEFNQENICAVLSGTASQNDMITITAELINGCTYDYLIPIEVDINTDIYIPNIFSPNGDGFNDVFTFYYNIPPEEIHTFSIYDRWGNRLFNQSNVEPFTFVGWNGKFKGQFVQPGVYVYSISVKLFDGQTKQFIGDLTVVK